MYKREHCLHTSPQSLSGKVCGQHSDRLALRPGQHFPFTSELHRSIHQFTVEEETDNTPAFLGTKITHHKNGSLWTTVFHKITHTDWYLVSDHTNPWPTKWPLHALYSIKLRGSALMYQTERRRRSKKHVAQALHNNAILVAWLLGTGTPPHPTPVLTRTCPRPP